MAVNTAALLILQRTFSWKAPGSAWAVSARRPAARPAHRCSHTFRKRRRYQPDNGRTDAGGQAGIGTGRWQYRVPPYRRLSFTVTKANRHASLRLPEKLSGKHYAPDQVKRILGSLGFTQTADTSDSITLEVPYNKSDISIPADIVEEIMRIDGLDQVEIPANHQPLAPSPDKDGARTARIERLAQYLTGWDSRDLHQQYQQQRLYSRKYPLP